MSVSVNMSVSKFGRSSKYRPQPQRGLQRHHGVTLTYTEEGNINFNNLRLCNVKDPVNESDACNKNYVNETVRARTEMFDLQYEQTLERFDDMISDIRDDLSVVLNEFHAGIGKRMDSLQKIIHESENNQMKYVNATVDKIVRQVNEKLDSGNKQVQNEIDDSLSEIKSDFSVAFNNFYAGIEKRMKNLENSMKDSETKLMKYISDNINPTIIRLDAFEQKLDSLIRSKKRPVAIEDNNLSMTTKTDRLLKKKMDSKREQLTEEENPPPNKVLKKMQE